MSKEFNQTVNVTVDGNVSGGEVTVFSTTVNNNQHHTHHYQHEHHAHTHHHNLVVIHPAAAAPPELPAFALQAPPAPPARKLKHAPRQTYDITPAQRALLALMRPLSKPDRAAVMDWMRREFGTSLVMDMTPAQLQRCRTRVLDRLLGQQA